MFELLRAVALDVANLVDAVLHRRRHRLVHAVVIGALDEVRRPAVAAQQALQFLMRDARQQRRIVDLVAVQMKDRQHRAIACRVEKLVDVPRRRQRSGLRFAIAHDGSDDQLRIVEGRAAGVRQNVSQLAAFVDRSRRLGRAVAANAAGEGELLEELAQAFVVLALLRIDLGVRSFEVPRAEHAGRAVSGAGEEDHVEVVLLDEPVEVDVDEGQAGARSPMAEQAVLDVLGAQRLVQQRIVEQVDHAQAQVIAGAPISVGLAQLVGAERRAGDGRPRGP